MYLTFSRPFFAFLPNSLVFTLAYFAYWHLVFLDIFLALNDLTQMFFFEFELYYAKTTEETKSKWGNFRQNATTRECPNAKFFTLYQSNHFLIFFVEITVIWVNKTGLQNNYLFESKGH